MISSCFIVFIYMITAYLLLRGIFFFKQKTAYEMRISDWSSDVCSSDLVAGEAHRIAQQRRGFALQKDAHRAPERRRGHSRFESRIAPPPLCARDDSVPAFHFGPSGSSVTPTSLLLRSCLSSIAIRPISLFLCVHFFTPVPFSLFFFLLF